MPPYGFNVTFERAKGGGGLNPEIERVTIRRKGGEKAAIKAAKLTSGFRAIISLNPIDDDRAPLPNKKRNKPDREEAGTAKALSPADLERLNDAINHTNRLVGELGIIADSKREKLGEIREHLRVIDLLFGFSPAATEQTGKVRRRCDRLAEYINIEELGSWGIEVNHAMEAIWDASDKLAQPGAAILDVTK
jgi:hypothetical protein